MAGPHVWIANVPASWAAASFSSGLLPASTETVIFDGTGQGSVVGGLNQTAVDLGLLRITKDYRGSIGVRGDPLIVSADEVDAGGAGQLHYRDGGGTTDLFFVRSPNVRDAVFVGGSTVTRLRVLQGACTIESDIGTIVHLELDPDDRTVASIDASLVVGFAPTNVTLSGGTLWAYNMQHTGVFAMTGGLFDLGPSRGFGSLNAHAVISGGLWRWTVPSADGLLAGVTNGTVNLVAGTLDCTPGGYRELTAKVWQGFEIIDPLNNLVLTATKMEP